MVFLSHEIQGWAPAENGARRVSAQMSVKISRFRRAAVRLIRVKLFLDRPMITVGPPA
jgi:hypothetical protein